MADISVVGGGSWATALTKILSDNGYQVHWWMRDEVNINFIREKGHNRNYLRAASLNLDHIRLNSNLSECILDSEIVFMAVPAAFLHKALSPLDPDALQAKKIVSAIKGIDPGSRKIISDYFRDIHGVPEANIAAIAGPCHAEEVAEELSSYLTLASADEGLAQTLAEALRRPHIFTSTSPDITGIEYAAVMKNIYAIAAGIAAGLREGDNFQSVLVSAAAREMRAFLQAADPRPERDICHSAYLGDLLVTCYSKHSRNRTFGNMIGYGYSVRAAQLEMNMVAEGYYAAKNIWQFCHEKQLDVPLAEAVYRILYERYAPRMEFDLMRPRLY